VKGEVVLVYAVKAHRGTRIATTRILVLCLAVDGGEWAASRPDRFTPGRETRYPLNSGLSALQNRSARFCRRETPPEGCTYVNTNVLNCHTLRDIWLKVVLAQSVLLIKLFILI
jgi:hypothetical protein